MPSKIFTKTTPKTKKRTTGLLTFFLSALVLLSSFGLHGQDILMGLTSNGGPEGKGTAYSIKTDTKAYSIIKSFADWGSSPESDLVRATDGFLYGTVPYGGTYGHGTLFRISTTGAITILKHFNMAVEGGYPKGSLIQAKDGNLYGMLNNGPSGGGAIFKMTLGGQFTVIKNLAGTDGGRPRGRLLQAADGHLYGMTPAGGAYGYGTIFRLMLDGQYTVLKSFQKTDGAEANGSLVQASDGALYGMTRSGGSFSNGVIFRITTGGVYNVIKHLNAATDAAHPEGNLIQGKDGWLYGLSPGGVNYNGFAFKIKLDGSSLTVLHKMSPGVDGGNPFGSLIQAKDGFFYGLNSIGGGTGYAGTAFKMAPDGTLSVIKRFTEVTEGGGPWGSLIQGSDGNFYGMMNDGGKHAKGTIFKLTTTGSLTVLAHLNGSSLGNEPRGNVAIGKDSAYFGVAKSGGAFNHGTIFKICGGVTTVLKSFNRNVDGESPVGGLLRGKDNNLYGMTEYGGVNGGGTIYRISPTGSFAVIRHLTAATDGKSPQGTLVQGADGYLYGVTYNGGTNGSGTIFKINTSGTVFTVLRHLVYSTDGSNMLTGLTAGTDGNFYGLTGNNSRFFKITPDGQFTVLKTFSYSTDGGTPSGNLVLGTDGAFYGTMNSGGTYSNGVIFKITTSGALTKLRHFNGTTDGGKPKAGLVQGSDGAFYGTTTVGGTNKIGTIFRIYGTSFSVLRNFNMATDGGTPLGGLIIMPKVVTVANAQSLATTEDVAKSLTLTGSGATNLTFSVVTLPRNGTVTGGTGATRTYTPKANFSGVDSFTFTANLGCLASPPAWVKITVSPVNDAPVLAPIGNKSVVKGSTLTFTATATDVDAGQTKTFSLINAPTGATINSTSGAFSWTPATTGTYTFTVRVTDNGSPVLYDEETISVSVTSPTLSSTTATSPVTDIKEVQEQKVSERAQIYPNPVSSQFYVTLSAPVQQVSLSVVDSKGAVISVRKYAVTPHQPFQVDASALRAGQYLLLLQSGSYSEILKFIKL